LRAVIQRVTGASVTVDDKTVAEITKGLVVLVGVGDGDSEDDARYLADKIANLRVFADEAERFNLSALDAGASILVVSQFTLLADTRKGRRPSFSRAAPPDVAEPFIEQFVAYLRETGLAVETGRFQQHMLVRIHNDGPVTIIIDSEDRQRPRRQS
jgi:D-tyrosyl-tRNA(Tyr) deacylase